MLASLWVTFKILISKKLIWKNIFELLLDSHAHLKKLSCSEAKLSSKPWITPGIWKSMKVKDRLQKKSPRAKDLIWKDALHNDVKQYQNCMNILTKNSKTNYYQEVNCLNINKIKKQILLCKVRLLINSFQQLHKKYNLN